MGAGTKGQHRVKRLSKRLSALILALTVTFAMSFAMLFALCSCSIAKPYVDNSVTPPPVTQEVTPEPAVESETTEPPVPDETESITVESEDFYRRHITFGNIRVYEQSGDTFADAVVTNEYECAIVCAVKMVYYDESGREIASGDFRTRDGQYLLVLETGETVVYAQLDTDISVLMMDFELIFDQAVGIKPRATDE